MKVDVSQHSEFKSMMSLGLKAVVGKALISTAQRIVSDIVVTIIPSEDPQPVDRGLYRAGWRVDAQKGVVYIVNSTPQSPFIEHGVRATRVKVGRKMIAALKSWVQRKGIGGSSKGPAWKNKLPKDEAESAAWAIAKTMSGYTSKAGWIPGTGIFKGTSTPSGLRIAERAMKNFDRYFREEVKRELKDLR